MLPSPSLDLFISHVLESIENNTFIKIVTSEKREKKSELKSISIKRILIKDGEKLSFTYRYNTKDIVKNYSYEDSKIEIARIFNELFGSLELQIIGESIKISEGSHGKIKIKTTSNTEELPPEMSHDKKKKRYIKIENNRALRALGVLNETFEIIPSMQDKFKQIDKFIEIVDGLLSQAKLEKALRVFDMGSGKGYLTFALYEYLTCTLGLDAYVSGIEFRPGLVDLCNSIAQDVGFANLTFRPGTIEDTKNDAMDILVALHACDTATDDSIYQWIRAHAKIIICSPCCHKQIRRQMKTSHNLSSLLKNGILEERQAEIATDAIRALLMEVHGYETKVFEYISSEHTGKNLMITGVLTNKKRNESEILEQIQEIKNLFGIQEHYLEKLLKQN